MPSTKTFRKNLCIAYRGKNIEVFKHIVLLSLVDCLNERATNVRDFELTRIFYEYNNGQEIDLFGI